jgi:serine protease Do
MTSGKRFWLLTSGFVASFLLGSWLAPRVRITWEPGPLPNEARAQAPTRARVTADEPVARAVEVASPSVVNIDTVKRVVRDDWFYGPSTQERRGAGSGVVIDSRGYVLTNEHVVSGADQITVTFGDGRKYPGTVLGIDRETDVAVVRLTRPPANLPVARLADSRRLVPGQWAIAIGNPYGFQQTVTVGVVGHPGRAIRSDERVYKRLVQTDAAINPGNSGGALVDIRGEVIGINTIVQANAQGIGFAIPIDVAKGIADELIRSGKIKRPWTGLNAEDVTQDIAGYLGLQRAEGAFVDQLDRRGPAWRAGVRPGDVIRELGGQRIRSKADVDAIVARARIGDKLPILVERLVDRESQLLRGEIVVVEKP